MRDMGKFGEFVRECANALFAPLGLSANAAGKSLTPPAHAC
jgi:hypothetical protein